jgi:trigger factor
LKIEITPRDDHQVRIVAEFETEFMERYKRQAARKISQDAKIPGFRPGKAPYDIIRRMYGEETIQKEAIELMLDKVYPEILKEAGIEPGGPGNLEEVISQDPPKLAFVVPLLPKVELGDYQTIRQEFIPPLVSDDEVDQVIKNLRANYSTAEPIDRPIEEGDLVTVKVSGEFTHPAEGQETVAIKENTVQMIVGENEFETDDWPYDGFTRELVSLKEKDEKEIVYQYPDDYVEEDLRGKEVLIKATVVSAKSLHLPELNDEFASTLGEHGTLEELRATIRQNLEDQANRDYENNYYNSLVDQIVASSKILYSPQVLEEEIERVKHNLEHDLGERKLDMPTYLKTLNKDETTFIEEDIKPLAKRRLERSLALDEVARAESIRLDPQDLQREVASAMEMMQQSDPQVNKLRGVQAQNFAQGLTMETATRMLNREVINRLKSIATGAADEMLETKSLTEEGSEEPVEAKSLEEEPVQAELSSEKPSQGELASEEPRQVEPPEEESVTVETSAEVSTHQEAPSNDVSPTAEETPAEEQPEDKSAEA